MATLCERFQFEIVYARDFSLRPLRLKLLIAKTREVREKGRRRVPKSSGEKKITDEKEQNFSYARRQRANSFLLRKGGNQSPGFK
jgi:hypothetical protein